VIDFYLVDVKSISSDIPRSNFNEDDLEKLADIILESDGIIKPVILKQTGVEEYSVVDGHFEYYVAVRAREKNSRKGEMVNSFIISPKVEDLVLKQIKFLKTIENSQSEINSLPQKAKSQPLANNQLSALEKQMSDLRIELSQEIQRLYSVVNQPKSQNQPERLTILEAFNKLNVRDLVFRLKTVNYSEKKAIEIAEKLEKERNVPFTSLSSIIERVKLKSGKRETKAISEKKMLQIVDTWSQLSFNE
jgi:hypothetical protein